MTGFYESGLGGTLTPHSIEEHDDTDFGTLATGDLLQWNAVTARWENVAPSTLYPAMNDITDASVPSPSDGQVIQWVAANNRWEAATLGGGGATALNGLTDVTLTSPSNGEVMVYNGAQWVNQAPTSGDLDGLTDVVITTPTVGDRIEWDGANWVNVPTGSIGNPLTIGTGVNGTSAGLILDAGNNTSGDLNYIEFQTNSTKRYSIAEANSVAGHFLNFRDSTDTNIFSVSNGLFAIQSGTEFRLVNENDTSRHWIFQATNDGSGYNSLSISDSVGSNQSIDIAATVDITGSLTVSSNIGSSLFTTSGRILEVGSFGVITQGSFATSDICRLSTSQTLSGSKTFSSSTTFNGTADFNQWVTFDYQSNSNGAMRVKGYNTGFGYRNIGLVHGTGSTIAGWVVSATSTTVTLTNSSDARLKTNIVDYDDTVALNAVKNIPVREFDWIEERGGHHQIGFIAQEVQDYIDSVEVVQGDRDGDYMTLSKDGLVPFLWAAVRALTAKVEALENGV